MENFPQRRVRGIFQTRPNKGAGSMTDIWEFLDEIAAKKENSYNSESIIKKASELTVDPKYAEMRKINPLTAELSSIYPCTDINRKFYLQAKLMEDFTDDYKITKVYYYSYYPRYDTLTFSELRGYFSWRTKYRNGEVIDVSITYLLIYLSELINFIGIRGAYDGLKRLKKLQKDYNYVRGFEISNHISDYAVYYNLKIENSDSFTQKLSLVMDNIKKNDFSDIMETLAEFSNYKISSSKFYTSEYKSLFLNVMPLVFKNMDAFYEKNRKISLSAKLFGRMHSSNWRPFQGLIFHPDNIQRDKEIVVNSCEKYICKDGFWRRYIYYNIDINKKLIGEILKTTEHFLRDMIGFSYKIKLKSTSKILTDLIKETVYKYLCENDYLDAARVKKAAQETGNEVFIPILVNIDKSKFESIRKVSEELRETLILEETEEPEEEKCTEIPEVTEGIYESGWEGLLSVLTTAEKDLLKALIKNESINDILKNEKMMQEVIFESINEKALSVVNDNIIDADELTVYNEYKDELTEVLFC